MVVMDVQERQRLLSKTIAVKKRVLAQYARFHGPGKPAYDYAVIAAARVKRPYLRKEI